MTTDAWLKRESLELQPIINLARGAEPVADWPPPKVTWFPRFRALKDVIDANEVLAITRGRSANIRTSVRLTDLWQFTGSRASDPFWKWLGAFCQRWAGVRGVDLGEAVQAMTNDKQPLEPMPGSKTRRSGEPKPETVAKWKADYDLMISMGVEKVGTSKASRRAYEPGGRSARAIERGYRHYKDHIKKRQNGNNPNK